MKIHNHIFQGTGINFIQSPNHGALFQRDYPDTIVFHYTAGKSAEDAINTLCDPKAKVSAHLVIARDGSITQLVPFNTIAWHAGISTFNGRSGLNKYSIGIELDNAGSLTKCQGGYVSWFGKVYLDEDVVHAQHRNESVLSFWHNYSAEQLNTVYDVCLSLKSYYNIAHILGHEEIAPGRKTDPGPAFPLDNIREWFFSNANTVSKETVAQPVKTNTLPQMGIIIASRLNIRSAPSLTAKPVAAPLKKGTQLQIISEVDGWYEVIKEARGWVKMEFVKKI